MRELLQRAAERAGFTLGQPQLDALQQLADGLIALNQHVNLTAITASDEIAIKHLLDSLYCLRVIEQLPSIQRLADVGSGAGFPGLVIKIARPQLDVTLIEATSKKADFIRQMVSELQLEATTVLAQRAEESGRQLGMRESFELVTARAVARLPILAELCLPLVSVGGHWLAQKGADYTDELSDAAHALDVLGAELSEVIPYQLPRTATPPASSSSFLERSRSARNWATLKLVTRSCA